MKTLVHSVVLSLACLAVQTTHAAAEPVEGQSIPYYVQVPMKATVFTIHLTTLVYTPPGHGPWPVVILNHGKASGPAHMQKDRAEALQAKPFNRMGYAVIVPTRAGFGDSGGTFQESCDTTNLGNVDANSIAAVIDWIKTQPQFEANTIVVQGQSTGGLSTVALAARNLPGVRAILDFAGGFKRCSDYIQADQQAFKTYGEAAREPTLMFYGTNDEYWGDQGPTFYTAYHQGNPNSALYNEGIFQDNSHLFFYKREGVTLWVPPVRQFLKQNGLPYEIVYRVNNTKLKVDRSNGHLTAGSFQTYELAHDRRGLESSP